MKKTITTTIFASLLICSSAQNNNTEWWENVNANNNASGVETTISKPSEIDFYEYYTVYGGMSLASLFGDGTKNMKNDFGVNLGFTYGGQFGNWGMEVGSFYNKICADYNYGEKFDISMNFWEVNLMAGYALFNKNGNTLSFNAGLGANIGLSAPMKAEDGSKVNLFGEKDFEGIYDSFTLTLIAGTTFRSKSGFTARILYHAGLRDLSKGNDAPAFFLNYWEFSLGYAFKIYR